jgi:hypothetical protein
LSEISLLESNKINCGRKGKPQVIHVDRIRKKYPQNLPEEESEQIESYEEIVAKDDLPNESMKTDKTMEFDSSNEISDNVGVETEAQKSGRQKRKSACLADYLPLFPRKTQSAHFLLLEDFVDISFLSYPHVLLVVYLFDHS